MKSFKQFVKEEMGSGAAGLQSSGGSPSVPGTTTSGGRDPIQNHIVKKTSYGSLKYRQDKLRPRGVVMPEGTVADQKIITANNSKTDPDPTGFVQKSSKEIEGTVSFDKKLKTKKGN